MGIGKTDSKEKPKKDSDRGFLRFKKATEESNDLVNIVLQSHLLVEYYLDQIILSQFSRGDLLIKENNQISFRIKILIVRSFNFFRKDSAALLDAVVGLNSVRNYCSHTLDYEISESDIDKIGRPYGKKYLKLKHISRDKKALLKATIMILVARLQGFTEVLIENKEDK